MATTTTSTSNFNKFVNVLIRKQLEELLRQPLPFIAPALKAGYVKGTNGTMRFLNVPDLTVTTGTPTPGTPPWLTEGVAPTGEALTLGYEEFTANQAGRVLEITDLAEQEAPMSLVDIAVERLARNVLAFANQRLADIASVGTNAIWSDATATQVNNSSDDLLAADVLQARDVRRATALLRALNVPPFPDGTYHGIINPLVSADLMAETAAGGWLDVSRYSDPEGILSGEVGRFGGVRFMESAGAPMVANAGAGGTVDVYSTIIFGPGPWVWGDFGTVEGYVTPPGGQSDPLHQKTKAGWKAFVGGMLVGEGANATNVAANKRYIRIESASSLGANT